MLNIRFAVLVAITILLGAAQLVPHPWNFTPVTAMALFGGAFFASKRAALIVPLVAVMVGDLILNHRVYGWKFDSFSVLPFKYACFLAIVGMGFALRQLRNVSWIAGVYATAGTTLAASTLYFLVTNYGFWWLYQGTIYSADLAGLLECYAMGLPFFRNMLVGDLCYVAVLFGGFALAQKLAPSLREERVVASGALVDTEVLEAARS